MTDRKSVRQTGRSTCYFCGSEGPIEEHHIIPRRHDGSDSRENLVDLCPTCHERLENLYNSRFYSTLGVESGGSPTSDDHTPTPGPQQFPDLRHVVLQAVWAETRAGGVLRQGKLVGELLNDTSLDANRDAILDAISELKKDGQIREPDEARLTFYDPNQKSQEERKEALRETIQTHDDGEKNGVSQEKVLDVLEEQGFNRQTIRDEIERLHQDGRLIAPGGPGTVRWAREFLL